MPNSRDYKKELCEYLRRNLKKGYTKESLRWALVSQGYSRNEVEKALKIIDMELEKQKPVAVKNPEKYEVVDIPEKPQPFWRRILGI